MASRNGKRIDRRRADDQIMLNGKRLEGRYEGPVFITNEADTNWARTWQLVVGGELLPGRHIRLEKAEAFAKEIGQLVALDDDEHMTDDARRAIYAAILTYERTEKDFDLPYPAMLPMVRVIQGE